MRPLPFRDEYSWDGADPRAIAGGGVLVSLGWAFVTVHTATALRSAASGGVVPAAFGVVLPLGLAATLFVGAIAVYRYDLGGLALRICLWTLFGMLTFVGVIGGALTAVDTFVPLLPVVLANVAAGGAVLGLLVGLYDARQRRLHRQLTREHRRFVDVGQRLSVSSRVHRHDFRNKLNLIIGTADVLCSEPEDVVPRALTIRDAATELSGINEDLRELERLRNPAARSAERVDLAAVVESAVASVTSSFPAATVDRRLPETLTVRASPLLHRAIEELVDNAVRYHCDDAPRVDVVSTEYERYVELSIHDDGPGISEDEIAVHRASAETSLSHSDGLGLWLAEWIVDASDGTLDIERGSDGGTVVTVRLPAADGASSSS